MKYIEDATVEYHPLPWHEAGLSQTATGYGLKLTTPYKARYKGRLYRVYSTCVSNAASHWIVSKGQKIHLRNL